MMIPFIINNISIFVIFSILGTTITLNSNTWWLGWLGMEVNLLGFIILLTFNNFNERSLKYFVVQSLGSVIFIRRSLLIEVTKNWFVLLLLVISLTLKLGAAPFHIWIPIIAENISKYQLLFLLTWQKLAPFFLLFSVIQKKRIFIFAVCSLIIGAVGSINELRTFTLLIYSSINHTGWILIILVTNELITIIYILIYTLLISNVIYYLNSKNRIILWLTNNKNRKILFFNILSLGGLPPFSGFIIKWILITELYKILNIFINFLRILTSIILLYFYLRLTVKRFLKSYTNLLLPKIRQNKFINIISILNLTRLCIFMLYIFSI